MWCGDVDIPLRLLDVMCKRDLEAKWKSTKPVDVGGAGTLIATLGPISGLSAAD